MPERMDCLLRVKFPTRFHDPVKGICGHVILHERLAEWHFRQRPRAQTGRIQASISVRNVNHALY